eukprot:4850302-Amphidinium_carterae.1
MRTANVEQSVMISLCSLVEQARMVEVRLVLLGSRAGLVLQGSVSFQLVSVGHACSGTMHSVHLSSPAGRVKADTSQLVVVFVCLKSPNNATLCNCRCGRISAG